MKLPRKLQVGDLVRCTSNKTIVLIGASIDKERDLANKKCIELGLEYEGHEPLSHFDVVTGELTSLKNNSQWNVEELICNILDGTKEIKNTVCNHSGYLIPSRDKRYKEWCKNCGEYK